MKNLTVNMPLAVPHQRPPSKYASHPYPVLVDEDIFSVSISPLNIELIQILKEALADDAYQASVKAIHLTLRELLTKVFIDADAYSASVQPLNIALKEPLIKLNIDKEGYQLIVKPLDITLKRLLLDLYVNDKEGYQPIVQPLDITLR